MLTNFINTFSSSIANINLSGFGDNQIISVLVILLCVFLAIEIIKKGFSLLTSIIACLAALYFIAPGVYATAIVWIQQLIHKIA